MKTRSRLLSVVYCSLAFGIATQSVYAHCRMSDIEIENLPKPSQTTLNSFHQKVSIAQEKVFKPRLATSPVKSPPPPPNGPSDDGFSRGNQPSEEYISDDSCRALFELVTDVYNSALCHLKHVSEETTLSENVACIANYPSSPSVVRNSMKAYQAVTDDEPLKAVLSTAMNDLLDFTARESICEKPVTSSQFDQEVRNYYHAKERLDQEIEEYDLTYMELSIDKETTP